MEAALTQSARDQLISPGSSRRVSTTHITTLVFLGTFRFVIVLYTPFRDERSSFIRNKYEARKYSIKTCADMNELIQELINAVDMSDIYGLLQVYAEGLDLMTTFTIEVNQ